MKKNAYLEKRERAIEMVLSERVAEAVDTVADLWLIAMNDCFGIGEKRAEQLAQRVTELSREYYKLKQDDKEHAKSVRERRVKQIVGDRKIRVEIAI